MTLSALVHVGLVAFVLFAARVEKPRGEMYAVNLVAAPPGPGRSGVVTKLAAEDGARRAAPQARRDAAEGRGAAGEATGPSTRATTSRATQVPDAKSARFDTPAPKAGGGETGGKGTDVANVSTAGKDFPYPAYLQNIINQIAIGSIRASDRC